MKTIEAKLFALLPKDFIKAAIVAGITAGISIVIKSLDAGSFPVDSQSWKMIGITCAKVTIAYLLKNLLTNSDGKFLAKEPAQ